MRKCSKTLNEKTASFKPSRKLCSRNAWHRPHKLSPSDVQDKKKRRKGKPRWSLQPTSLTSILKHNSMKHFKTSRKVSSRIWFNFKTAERKTPLQYRTETVRGTVPGWPLFSKPVWPGSLGPPAWLRCPWVPSWRSRFGPCPVRRPGIGPPLCLLGPNFWPLTQFHSVDFSQSRIGV